MWNYIIISTRKLKPKNKETLENIGYIVEDSDFVEIRSTLDANKKDILIRNTSPLIFTSQHAVKAIQIIIPELGQKWVFCINWTTSTITRELGLEILGIAPDAQSLAEIVADLAPESALHVTSSVRRSELARWLMEAHIPLQILEVYEKIPRPKKVESYDAILFFSPSQVDSFLELNTINPDVPVFSIGQTTTNHLMKLWFKNITTAIESSEEKMITTVINHFQ